MLTIFIIYSTDRKEQLEKTISCLKDMKYYNDCQKVLVVDGKAIELIPDFDIINVPRINNKFNWSNMWAAGVGVAKNEVIWYLDSDRLLPNNYIELILNNIKDDVFLFTSLHFMVLKNLLIEDCKRFLNNKLEEVLYENAFIGAIEIDPRFINPVDGPGKNVMSGNTAFTKKTFFKLKEVDPWYCGHGAYADTDFHRKAAQFGCKFIDLYVQELHCHHLKKEKDIEVDDKTLSRLALDNFIYYCLKWDILLSYAEEIAFNCSILKPKLYIEERVKKILDDSPRMIKR